MQLTVDEAGIVNLESRDVILVRIEKIQDIGLMVVHHASGDRQASDFYR